MFSDWLPKIYDINSSVLLAYGFETEQFSAVLVFIDSETPFLSYSLMIILAVV